MKLQAVGLRGAAELMPAELSGGMARRVALARAIVMDPEMLIYDEPFVGLDPISMGVIVRLIESLNRTLQHHQYRGLARRAGDQRDRALQLSARRAARSWPRGCRASSRLRPTPVVQQFMSGVPDGPVPFHYPAPDYYQQLLERRD